MTLLGAEEAPGCVSRSVTLSRLRVGRSAREPALVSVMGTRSELPRTLRTELPEAGAATEHAQSHRARWFRHFSAFA